MLMLNACSDSYRGEERVRQSYPERKKERERQIHLFTFVY